MIGSHLGERYQLTVLLQEGPIFTAYAARDKVLGRDVIIRIVRQPFSSEEEFLQALDGVIKRAGSVTHPNVEKMFELQQAKDVNYIVSETSRGSGLTERIRKLAPYSAAVSVSMVISILEGLEAIHNSGYIHGDAGAHNIVVQADGVARLELAGLWEAYAVSQSGSVVMLPLSAPYIAPEVAAGGPPSPPSDTYAVGVILFQLLTGRYPYQADTAVATAMKHASAPIPTVRSINPGLPVALDDLIQHALAKDPSQRYQNATRMLTELHKIESSVRFGKTAPVAAPKPPEPTPVAAPAPAPQIRPEKVKDKPKEKPIEKVVREEVSSRHTFVEEREPRDVPVWLTVSATFVLAVLVSLVGFWYYFMSSAPKSLTVPDLRGKTQQQAQDALAALKLNMRVSIREASEKIPADSVIDLEPQPGQQVKEGGTVAVRVSSGSKLVTLPDFRGKSVENARDVLSKLNLELDRTEPIPDSRVPSGMVVRQSPDPKSKLERFTHISLWVSTGPPQDEEPSPDSTPAGNPNTRFLYTVKIRLTKITDPVVLRVDIRDANGIRKIYEAQRQPNDLVSIKTEGYGDQATFTIYYNGSEVSTVTKQADEPSSPSTPSNNDNSDNGDGNNDNGDQGDNTLGQDNGAGI